jgi:hypothetical protein
LEKRAMIIRLWRGRTSASDADGYERFLKEMPHPDYGEVPGNRGLLSDIVEFMFVPFWGSMDALAEYTGGDPERPKYYPEEGGALSDRGPSSALVRLRIVRAVPGFT